MIEPQEGQGGATVVYERSDPQWPAIWAALGRRIVAEGLGDGTDLVQLHDGEGWQYLCTTIAGDGQRHSFRHRSHPRAGVRVSFDLPTRED
jgi:hypothetical protein